MKRSEPVDRSTFDAAWARSVTNYPDAPITAVFDGMWRAFTTPAKKETQ